MIYTSIESLLSVMALPYVIVGIYTYFVVKELKSLKEFLK